MGIKIFLDDVRQPPDKSWILCTNVTDAIYQIDVNDHKEKIHISFDHDLGKKLSGYDLARYIEKWAFHNLLNRMTWEVHSANPVGRKSIEMAMTNADKYWTQHENERETNNGSNN